MPMVIDMSQCRKTKTSRGFTIVELLIVIIVIAILAAITIVTYQGIQTRSKNSAQHNAVQQEIKLLMGYKAINGSYPTETGCLGANNVDTNADTFKDCGDNGDHILNQTLIDQLNTVGTQPNVVTDQILGTDAVNRAGVFWNGVSIVWFIRGSTSDCAISTTSSGSRGESTWCVKTL